MKYIKYKRFIVELNGDEAIQKFLDELIIGGWEIINYSESIINVHAIQIIALCGKYAQNKIVL